MAGPARSDNPVPARSGITQRASPRVERELPRIERRAVSASSPAFGAAPDGSRFSGVPRDPAESAPRTAAERLFSSSAKRRPGEHGTTHGPPPCRNSTGANLPEAGRRKPAALFTEGSDPVKLTPRHPHRIAVAGPRPLAAPRRPRPSHQHHGARFPLLGRSNGKNWQAKQSIALTRGATLTVLLQRNVHAHSCCRSIGPKAANGAIWR